MFPNSFRSLFFVPSRRLKKFSQTPKFNNVFGGHDSAHKVSLRGGVDLIEVMLRCGLGHELPDALIQCIVGNEIRNGAP